ncbi:MULTISPECIES: hypothetical protein [unclassified Legionella]|uniref:hypothetical protein n=1 Tax=unclassified Legionella TaxID=2622702 RepID=UPI00105644EA|nr:MULTISPECIES: hypothetical protein [unclassified Legionella]MDI9818120.1 hypothetical protein [Legionella sp. PL877]
MTDKYTAEQLESIAQGLINKIKKSNKEGRIEIILSYQEVRLLGLNPERSREWLKANGVFQIIFSSSWNTKPFFEVNDELFTPYLAKESPHCNGQLVLSLGMHNNRLWVYVDGDQVCSARSKFNTIEDLKNKINPVDKAEIRSSWVADCSDKFIDSLLCDDNLGNIGFEKKLDACLLKKEEINNLFLYLKHWFDKTRQTAFENYFPDHPGWFVHIIEATCKAESKVFKNLLIDFFCHVLETQGNAEYKNLIKFSLLHHLLLPAIKVNDLAQVQYLLQEKYISQYFNDDSASKDWLYFYVRGLMRTVYDASVDKNMLLFLFSNGYLGKEVISRFLKENPSLDLSTKEVDDEPTKIKKQMMRCTSRFEEMLQCENDDIFGQSALFLNACKEDLLLTLHLLFSLTERLSVQPEMQINLSFLQDVLSLIKRFFSQKTKNTTPSFEALDLLRDVVTALITNERTCKALFTEPEEKKCFIDEFSKLIPALGAMRALKSKITLQEEDDQIKQENGNTPENKLIPEANEELIKAEVAYDLKDYQAAFLHLERARVWQKYPQALQNEAFQRLFHKEKNLHEELLSATALANEELKNQPEAIPTPQLLAANSRFYSVKSANVNPDDKLNPQSGTAKTNQFS